MEEEAIKMHGKVFLNDTEKIANFFSLSSVDEQVENLYFCDSIQKIFSHELPNKSHKSEGILVTKLKTFDSIYICSGVLKVAWGRKHPIAGDKTTSTVGQTASSSFFAMYKAFS